MFGHSARRCAARGARHLDQKLPGWENEINVFILEVRDPGCCPLGQLRPDGMGFLEYAVSQSKIQTTFGVTNGLRWSRRHGFTAPAEFKLFFNENNSIRQYDALTEAWQDEIAKRLVSTIIDEVKEETRVKELVNG